MTLDVTKHNDQFSTSPQIAEADIPAIVALGYKAIMNNRPDGEEGPEQPSSDQIKAAAEKAGLVYIHIPVTPGSITPENISACKRFLAAAPAPVFAFCRSGTRSGNLYKMTIAG